jgi:hypothetical protein
MTQTTQWRATVAWPRPESLNSEALDRLVRGLPGFGIAGAGDRLMHAEMTVEAPTLRAATEAALRAARAAHQDALGRPGEPRQLRVLTVADFDDELARPAAAELVGLAEVAEELGVSRQRAGQLVDENPDFPGPVARLASGPVFTRASVLAFGRRWERRPGRPRKAAAAPA